jgi:hypothetical protein
MAAFSIAMDCPVVSHDIYKQQDALIIAKCVTKTGGYVLNSYIYGISRKSSVYKKLVLIDSLSIGSDFSEINIVRGKDVSSFFLFCLDETFKTMKGYLYNLISTDDVYYCFYEQILSESCKYD